MIYNHINFFIRFSGLALIFICAVNVSYVYGEPLKINPFPDVIGAPKVRVLNSDNAAHEIYAPPQKNVVTEPEVRVINTIRKSGNFVQNEAQRMEVLERITKPKILASDDVQQEDELRTKKQKKPMTVEELNEKYNKGLYAQKLKNKKPVSSKVIPKIVSLKSKQKVITAQEIIAPVPTEKSPEDVPEEVSFEVVSSIEESEALKALEILESTAEKSASDQEIKPAQGIPDIPQQQQGALGQEDLQDVLELDIPAPDIPAPDIPVPVSAPVEEEIVTTPPVMPAKSWQALKDASLLDTLDGWSRKKGVTLVWNTNASYFIPETLLLDGTYENAVQKLLEEFADVPFRPVGELFLNEGSSSDVLVIQSLE